jgi:hypothetical protein
MKRTLIFIAGIALALPPFVAAAQEASARTVQYHSQDIVPIRAKVKYTTLIEVPPTEKIMEAATGDKDFWIVDVVGNFCFVHPAKQGISSNLNLITDKGNIYNTDNNVQDLKNQLQAERQKEQQQAALVVVDPALASATPAQQAAAAAYGPTGVAAPCVPGQPCPQPGYGQPGSGQSQLSPEQQQVQQLAAKERERADESRFASNLVPAYPLRGVGDRASCRPLHATHI